MGGKSQRVEKIVLFLLEQQGVLAHRLSQIGQEHHTLQQQPNTLNISELQEAYREVGRDLLRVLHFVEMNAIGLRKILKKFDKRFGYKFTDYYVKTRANHPYSQLRQVFRHVGIGAVVGVLSHCLADLQDLQLSQGSYISIYDQPTYAHQDPVLDSIKVAVDRLFKLNKFPSVFGKTRQLLFEPWSSSKCVCVVIGSMAVAQVFSSVYFSAWSNRSYLRPLIFSSIVLLVGNTMYALAYDMNSIVVLLMGRLFLASAGFVSASALGMACGPALACLLQTNFKIYKFTMNQDTLPGWVMACAWLCLSSVVMDLFQGTRSQEGRKFCTISSRNCKVAIFLACLGLTVLPVNIVVGNYISNMFEERQVLLTSEIMVCIGLLLSFHILVPYSVTQYVGSALITFVSAEVLEEIFSLNMASYLCLLDQSRSEPFTLSKLMSSRLSRGTFNGGLLSTEAGTLARVIADGTITVSGYLNESKLLNTTLLPALIICISSIIATCYTYNSLY
ncbi:SPX domain [Sesbania bispinosa]|nr:SPX domain [Sesbania bispinosa]